MPVVRVLPSAGGLAAQPVHADRGEVERVFALAERLGSISEATSRREELLASFSNYQRWLAKIKAIVHQELDPASGTTGWTLLVELAAAPEFVRKPR